MNSIGRSRRFWLTIPPSFSGRSTFSRLRHKHVQLRYFSSIPVTSPEESNNERTPSKWKSYAALARIDKPAGTWLLYLPCSWSILMACDQSIPSIIANNQSVLPVIQQSASMLALFAAGAFIMRGAGCTINDLWDIKYDKQVARTKSRPLASGALSKRDAVSFLALQLSVGLGILTQLNLYSILLGASSMALVVSYPLAKRYTNWPQAVLGLTFNWGALLGWSAMMGDSMWSCTLPLYAGSFYWTLVYDTVYAHQDKIDDRRVGVKSTALLFGTDTKSILTGFSAISFGLLMHSGMTAGCDWPFIISLIAAGTHVGHGLKTVHLDNPASCGKFFNNSWQAGTLLSAGLVADIAFKLL